MSISSRLTPREIKEQAETSVEELDKVRQLISSREVFRGVIGLEEAKSILLEEFLKPLYFPDECGGAKPISGFLLHGPPGTGKTEFVRAVANNLGVSFKEVKPSDVFVGSQSDDIQAIRKVFDWTRKQRKGAIFFDEVDGLFSRKNEYDASWDKETLAELLGQADGLVKEGNVLLISCTNKPWALDEAAMRPGRFSRLVYGGPPSVKEREELFKFYLKGRLLDEKVDPAKLAQMTAPTEVGFYSGADIMEMCESAARKRGREPITMGDLEQAVKAQRPSIPAYLVRQFEQWMGVKREGSGSPQAANT